MTMDMKTFSCMDCKLTTCSSNSGFQGETWPDFCLTKNTEDEKYKEWLGLYEEGRNQEIMKAAADVEFEGYCQWPRALEIVEFAKRIGAKKIGIASCVGLAHEAQLFTKILRSHGFEVYGAFCKVGATLKTEVGIDEKCFAVGETMCNPIVQAQLLNEAKTDLNVVMGLCVGHDSLFYKYSEAITTTLITKDRVTGHNPAAALYTLNSYYKKLLGEETK